MSAKDSKSEIRSLVQSDRIADAGRKATGISLDTASEKINKSAGLAGLFLPGEYRALGRELRSVQLKEAKKLAECRLELEADLRIQAIDMSAEQERAEMLNAQNSVMGALKQRSTEMAADALREQVAGERRRQQAIANSNCCPEDKQMLSQLCRGLTHANIRQLAHEHGVGEGQRHHPDEDPDTAE